MGYYWIKTFFWIFCFAKILRTRKRKLKFGQISTKPGQNISRLSFLHHKLHEFSYPCHSLVSSFFSTHWPVPTRCVVLVYFSIPRINRCTCAYFYQVLLCNPKIPDSMEEVNFSSLNTFEKNFPPKFWSISISILTWKNNHEGRTVSLAVKNKNGYHKCITRQN